MLRLLSIVLFVTVAASRLAAQPASAEGAWAFSMSSPMGSVDAKVELKVEGETLAGEFDLGGGRTWPIEDGTLEGDIIAFTLNRDGRMTYEMKGKLDGDTIKGVASAMGTTVDWTMTRAR